MGIHDICERVSLETGYVHLPDSYCTLVRVAGFSPLEVHYTRRIGFNPASDQLVRTSVPIDSAKEMIYHVANERKPVFLSDPTV